MNQPFRVIFQMATGTYSAVTELAWCTGKAARFLVKKPVVRQIAMRLSFTAATMCSVGIGTAYAQVTTTGTDSGFTIGGSTMTATNCVAVGITSGANANTCRALNALALGSSTWASGISSVAVGTQNFAYGNQSISIGQGSIAGQASTPTSANDIAIGTNASATGASSVALGDTSSASAAGSVALGQGSVANLANTVSVGSASLQRQIVNVAAGVQATDAVNVSQLKAAESAFGGGASVNATTGAITGPTYHVQGGTQTNVGDALGSLDSGLTTTNQRIDGLQQTVNNFQQNFGALNDKINQVAKNAYSGVAAATALTMIPQPRPGKTVTLGAGVAKYKGQTALALGATGFVGSNVTLRGGVGVSGGNTTAGAGMGIDF